MKKLFLFVAFVTFSNACFCQSALDIVKAAVENRMEQISKNWSTSKYTSGSFKVTESNESSANQLILYGTVDYQSDNCGRVHTTVTVTIKRILDSFEITQLCISIPYCALGLEYDRERKCW